MNEGINPATDVHEYDTKTRNLLRNKAFTKWIRTLPISACDQETELLIPSNAPTSCQS